MVDTVTNITIHNSPKRLVTKHLSLSDGTGESNVVKVDKSTFTGPDGTEPSFFMIEKVQYDIAGMEILISVDLTTDQNLFRLTGAGILDFRDVGGISTTGSGGTGDLLLSTNAHSSGDSYDITIYMRKKD